MAADPTRLQEEPGSFRDPQTRVYYQDGEVRRALGPQAAADWATVKQSGFWAAAQQSGSVVATDEVDPHTLRHERIPFVAYPYEWSFGMLRDAAALHLDLLRDALAAGLTMKDGTAYNVQFRGAVPQFIDVGSFEPARPGEPWAGYRQFCQTMLYPLMLQAHLDLDFQPWLRSRVDGVEPGQMRKLFGGLGRTKAGVLKHVHLHDAMQSRNADRSTESVRGQLKDAGFNTELVAAAVRALAKLVDKLDWRPPATHWGEYRGTCTYSEDDRAAKAAFVDAALAGADRLDLALDLGANDGVYSRQAAERAAAVVAVEADPAVVDLLHRDLRDEGNRKVLPLVMDLADPSPGGGWAGIERASFATRAQPSDAVLALALVHHLAIGRNVPLPQVVDWLAGHGRLVVVEFVHPDDPQVRRLLANKPEGLFPDYHREAFEKHLADRLTIVRREELPGGTRTLYAGVRRD